MCLMRNYVRFSILHDDGNVTLMRLRTAIVLQVRVRVLANATHMLAAECSQLEYILYGGICYIVANCFDTLHDFNAWERRCA